MVTIKIIEENNILKIKEDYAPVVCGNTNYQLEFELGEDWNNIKEKTAIFIAEDHKTAVDLKNNIAKMPAMPNAQFVQVFLISAENEENRLLSSSVEIKLLPTKSAESLPDFKPLSAYVSEIISNINALKNGTIEVAKSKQADFASNVSNPNLLINGDFRVNQRGQTTYTEASKYTVDRWRMHSVGTVTVNSNHTITYTIGANNWAGLNYYIEKPSFLSNKAYTFSMKGSSTAGIWLSVYQNGISLGGVYTRNSGDFYLTNTITFGEILDSDNLTIRITTRNTDMPAGVENNSFTLEFVKLEVGTTATPLSPRSYAEELANCQRYGFMLEVNYRSRSVIYNSLIIDFKLPLLQTLRIKPTINFESFELRTVQNTTASYSPSWSVVEFLNNELRIRASILNGHTLTDAIFHINTNTFVDAEIY